MKKTLYLIALMALIFVLWPYPLLYPVKLLVVFFHEASHALATVLSGGSVEELVIVKGQGGYVLSHGGNRFVILSAGYLGSLAFGALIYVLAVKSRHDRMIMSILAFTVILITVLYANSLFSRAFGFATGCSMLAAAYYLNRSTNDFLLRLIALTNLMYVPLDIYSDTIQRPAIQSDASLLAREFGGTASIWGLIWLCLSLLLIGLCLSWSLKPGRKFKRR